MYSFVDICLCIAHYMLAVKDAGTYKYSDIMVDGLGLIHLYLDIHVLCTQWDHSVTSRPTGVISSRGECNI